MVCLLADPSTTLSAIPAIRRMLLLSNFMAVPPIGRSCELRSQRPPATAPCVRDAARPAGRLLFLVANPPGLPRSAFFFYTGMLFKSI
jgi:hypothetical protein